MKKIYYKEGKHINNKKDYIITCLTKNTPTTYFVENDFIQCRNGMARIFNDLLLLLKSKFKIATKGELARILLNKNNPKVGMFYCNEINRLVLDIRDFDDEIMESFINDDTDPLDCSFPNKNYLYEGPSLAEVVKLELKSKKFTLEDIDLNPFID